MDRALEISERNGFEISEGWLNLVKFYLHVNQGEFAEGQPYFQRLIQIARKFNNPQNQCKLAANPGQDGRSSRGYRGCKRFYC